ncbi:sodium ion-translocating decarboxylase subunit beta [Ruminococcaceae bacterium OttesenSCG-928-L11]|nr:sodium ion-translocating decarboxylase subunit beta [Ruminococcaceae bacterium OttesenSCG-928-L11]
MKLARKITGGLSLFFLGAALVAVIISRWGFSLGAPAAIGIIGGADGPTVIYTATKLAPPLHWAAKFAPSALLGITWLILRLLSHKEK